MTLFNLARKFVTTIFMFLLKVKIVVSLETFVNNLNFDSWHNCQGFQHYQLLLNFGLIESYYHDNYRNRNFSIFQSQLLIHYNPHDYCKHTQEIQAIIVIQCNYCIFFIIRNMAIIKLYFSNVFLWKFTQKNDHGDLLKNSMRMNSVR